MPAAFLALSALPAMAGETTVSAAAPSEAWQDLKSDVYGDRNISDGRNVMALDAPLRPDDQTAVPISVKASLKDGRTIRRVTFIIDNNPAPVAADFTIHQPRKRIEIAGKFRFNRATDVRAVVEASDGSLFMVSKFVKFAGGQAACSAPPNGDPAEIAASMGRMALTHNTGPDVAASPTSGSTGSVLAFANPRLGAVANVDGPPASAMASVSSALTRRARLKIRHPNHTGMVLDQITLLYIPLRMITALSVQQGDEPVLSMAGSISIAQDPEITFDYRPNGAREMTAVLKDSDGAAWSKTFPIGPAT